VSSLLSKPLLDHLSQVQSFSPGRLPDLFVTAKAVGNDQSVVVQTPDRREQYPLAASNRYVIVLPLKPERTCHAAAASLGHVVFDAQLFKYRLVVVHLEDRLMVAVPVNEGFFVHVRDLEAVGPLRKKIA
jgi:hypothetical protein